ncbi:MAG TPA: Gfo/Idh/MocA family oxidoreductase, partial [Segetibacter sp.]
MKKYNVGIIGYGWVASAHIEAINSCTNAQVTAVYSSRILDDNELSEKWSSPIKTYTDLNA